MLVVVAFVALLIAGAIGYVAAWRAGFAAGNHPRRRRTDAPYRKEV